MQILLYPVDNSLLLKILHISIYLCLVLQHLSVTLSLLKTTLLMECILCISVTRTYPTYIKRKTLVYSSKHYTM